MEDSVTRLEIIDHSIPLEEGGGRQVIFQDPKKRIFLEYQDVGRTLKIFIVDRKKEKSYQQELGRRKK